MRKGVWTMVNSKEQTLSYSFKVKECAEFEVLGVSFENIKTLDDAIKYYNSIPANRLYGQRSISIIYDDKELGFDELEFPLITEGLADMDLLDHFPTLFHSKEYLAIIADALIKFNQTDIRMPDQLKLIVSEQQKSSKKAIIANFLEETKQYRSDNIMNTLLHVPSNDGNYISALQRASREQLTIVFDILSRYPAGNSGRIATVKRQLKLLNT